MYLWEENESVRNMSLRIRYSITGVCLVWSEDCLRQPVYQAYF